MSKQRTFSILFILLVIICILNVVFFVFNYCNFVKFDYYGNDRLSQAEYTYNYPIEQLPKSDYSRLINLTDFRFDILNECTFNPFLLIFVHTHPKNFDRRKTIRQTWGGFRKNDVKVVFMLGSVKDLRLQGELKQENEKYQDIVQGSFLDAQRNLTYKHIMGFKYTIYHCSRAKFIIKADDDTFLNLPVMIELLNEYSTPCGAKELLLCSVRGSAVVRDPNSQWYVSTAEFKGNSFPSFCGGHGMTYSPDMVFAFYRDAQKSKYFPIDDVFVTGILAKENYILHIDLHPLVLSTEMMNRILKEGQSYNGSRAFLYGPPNVSINQTNYLWNFVVNNTKSDEVAAKV